MADLLARFLHDTASRPFRLGVHDCGLWLADWCVIRRGVDPAVNLRGRYHNQRSLEALGNLPRVFDRAFREAGMVRTIRPIVGDVAMIKLLDMLPTGAIRTARGFVLLAERHGVCSIPAHYVRLIAAWKV